MKRTIIISLLIITFILTVTILFLNRADYHGKIGEMNEGNFYLAPLKVDPEAEYNSPVIYFNGNTKVVGKVNYINDLQVDQEVKVWIQDGEGKKVAYKIEVINE